MPSNAKKTFIAAMLPPLFLSVPNSATADEANAAEIAPARAEARSGLDRNPLNGPDSASSLIRSDREEKADVLDQNLLQQWEAWKAGIANATGLSFGADYTAVGFAATESLGDDTSAGGIARLFGSWAILNRGGENTGSLEFKGEYRHAYTDVAPFAFGGEVGYVGTPEPVFNDEGFRATTLYWKQNLFSDRAVLRVGFLDVKEYFDVYALASPWTGFHNLAFSTGSNTMIVLPDAALGAMAGAYLTDNLYMAASVVDASAKPTDMFNGFDTFFNDFDTFSTVEVGITGGGKAFFLNNAHVAYWHLDDSEENGTPGGQGITASVSSLIDVKWLPFLRAGWADEGGGLYETSVSGGFGYANKPGGNLLAVGLNWGRPNSDTFGVDLDEQWTGEVIYRVQLAENFQITPSVQLYKDPAVNPDDDFVALFGLRGRVSF